MPVFSPPRYQGPFRPVRMADVPAGERLLIEVEKAVKGPLFGCRMCGNCILQETAFVCPMTCPKGLRNGLCGGATPEACEVDPSRPCTWYVIYQRAEKLGREQKLLEINAPIDGARAGRETWGDVVKKWVERKAGPNPLHLITDRERFSQEYEDLFRVIRQPDWWQGDSDYHPPAYTEPVSGLERALRGESFVVTTEIAPPLGADGESIARKLEPLRDRVAAINFTDNASATSRMSSLTCSLHCCQADAEPIFQIQARDRNRIEIQAEALGASSLGIRNILCITGDHPVFGRGPLPIPEQFDLDAIQTLWLLRRLRDEGLTVDGRKLETSPVYFLGAAASPFSVAPKYEALRCEKKVNAGAQFIETQPIFDRGRFTDWLEALDRRGLVGKVHILAGIVPLRSLKAAQYMNEHIPGVVIPEALIRRIEAAGESKQAQQEVAFEIALEQLQWLRTLPGIRGVHIMAVGWESVVPRLLDAAGLVSGKG